METLKVGIREFREKLANYLLQCDKPLAITRHGDTVGYYLPARRRRSEAERTALKEAAARLQEMLAAVNEPAKGAGTGRSYPDASCTGPPGSRPARSVRRCKTLIIVEGPKGRPSKAQADGLGFEAWHMSWSPEGATQNRAGAISL
jgi:PHD/YefM family antitoxin component YafN of YafNO toxin-antitoxin module